jgi:hypothetical protein
MVPKVPALSTTSGSADRGTPNSSQSPSSHVAPASGSSSVRLALPASDKCAPVSLKVSHDSIVPNARRSAAAAAATAGSLSSSQRILVAEK